MRIVIAAVLVLLAAAPAHAQTATPPAGYKDPGTAMLIGLLVPGGGQMYAGETKRGVTILGVGMGSLLAGSMLSLKESSDCLEGLECSGGLGTTPLLLGYLGYLAAWGYGVLDADDSAERVNASRGLAVAGMAVEPIAAPSPGGTRLGVQLRF